MYNGAGWRHLLHSSIAISMLVLALDTTTRTGSLALTRDGAVLEVHAGDPGRTHGQRLPADIQRLLDRQQVGIRDVDLYGVAAGPGSFTGLRIGLATMQGLALVSGRGLIGVSTFDALREAFEEAEAGAPDAGTAPRLVGAWIDGQRGEVFTALYRGERLVDGPVAEPPDVTLSRWAALGGGLPIVFVGGGALLYASAIGTRLPGRSRIVDPTPLLAPAVARLAERRARSGAATAPEALQPLYVRRSDAEIARDRTKG
jgi:tRNA threonylcarbamoyladenosine biosynthesis protein TsaB